MKGALVMKEDSGSRPRYFPAGRCPSDVLPRVADCTLATVDAVRSESFDCDASPRQTQTHWCSLVVCGDRCGRRGGSGAVALARSDSPCEIGVHRPVRRQFCAVRGGVRVRRCFTPHRRETYVCSPCISGDRGDRLRGSGSRLARRRPSPVHRSPHADAVVNRCDAV